MSVNPKDDFTEQEIQTFIQRLFQRQKSIHNEEFISSSDIRKMLGQTNLLEPLIREILGIRERQRRHHKRLMLGMFILLLSIVIGAAGSTFGQIIVKDKGEQLEQEGSGLLNQIDKENSSLEKNKIQVDELLSRINFLEKELEKIKLENVSKENELLAIKTRQEQASPEHFSDNDINTTAIGWHDSVESLKISQSVGLKFTFYCLSYNASHRIWGTDIYTGGSSICEAAVHSGVFPRKEGGNVTIEVTGGRDSFLGSQRYGVLTKEHGPHGTAFKVVRQGIGDKLK